MKGDVVRVGVEVEIILGTETFLQVYYILTLFVIASLFLNNLLYFTPIYTFLIQFLKKGEI